MADQWINVDREGLRQLLEGRPKSFVLTELIQNAWDQNVKEVDVTFSSVGHGICELTVTDDDPDGFLDLSDAYTMFKASHKKSDPKKRGFINQGEKLVLALCKSAVLVTTKGSVFFLETGERSGGRKKRAFGSEIVCQLKMSKSDMLEAEQVIDLLHVPSHIKMKYNGRELHHYKPLHVFEASLPTRCADSEGNMRQTIRKTEIRVYQKRDNEPSYIYEMGIPIVTTEDKWHYDVQQRVLLNTDRDNVTPAYLQRVRTLVFNEMAHYLQSADDVAEHWVREATSNPDCTPSAFTRALDLRFGTKRAMTSPRDPESMSKAQSHGYTILSGGHLSTGEHENNRRFGATQSSASLFPTPNPYSDDPDAEPELIMPLSDWSKGQHLAAQHARILARNLIGKEIVVEMALWTKGVKFAAAYGKSRLVFNYTALGEKFFGPLEECEPCALEAFHDLLLHELAHDKVANHLSYDYQSECTRLGAKLVRFALANPQYFQKGVHWIV